MDDIRDVENAIFFKKGNDFELTDMFELFQSFKAQLWQNLYSNTENLVDVKGQDSISDANAVKQKQNIVKYLENAKVQDALDKSIDYLLKKSEAILQISWKVSEKQVRRQEDTVLTDEWGEAVKDEYGNVKTVKKAVIKTVDDYDGLDIKAIDPENFVYDTQKKTFYIYQTFVTCGELQSSKQFNLLNAKELKELKDLCGKDIKPYDENDREKNTKGIKDGKIELLEYWGDIEVDGKLYKNQVIVVAGRKTIIRQELNPYIMCPFVITELLKDPVTDRGFLYLKTALKSQEISQKVLNNNINALDLINNPPYLSPKGAFSNSEIKVKPGKIVEYDASLMPQAPAPLEFSKALQGWDFIQYFRQSAENATGIFKNQVGAVDTQQRTATEVSATVSGQNVRLSMIVDILNQNLIIPMIEKSAELIANLVFGEERLYLGAGLESSEMIIDDNVRQGKYKYIYGDRNAIQERKMKFKELYEVASGIIDGFQEIKGNINGWELFKFALEQYGFDNFEKFENKQGIMNGIPQGIGQAGIIGTLQNNQNPAIQAPNQLQQGAGLQPDINMQKQGF